MPRRRLSDQARRYLQAFETETGVQPRDCVVDEDRDRVIVLIPAREIATAIGPGGETVAAAEEALGTDLKLVADATTAADLVANALAPAAVYDVVIDEQGEETVATVTIAKDDVGVAIGADGRNIEAARILGRRHFGVTDIEITTRDPEGDV